MMDVYGLAAVYLQKTLKDRPAWNEADALWFDPDGAIARIARFIRKMATKLVAERTAERSEQPANRCAPTQAA